MNIRTIYFDLSEDALAAMMNSQSWKTYSRQQRLDLLQEVEIRMAKKQGREALRVKTFPAERSNAGLMGYFSMDETGSLYLNENFAINKSGLMYDYSVTAALNTLIHEGRHAYQFAVAYGKCPAPDEETRQRWKLNFAHYLSCGDTHESQVLYVQQNLEQDARTYALNEMKKLYKRMCATTGSDDLQYLKSLAILRCREDAYQEMAKLLLTRSLLDEVERKAREAFERAYPGETLKVSIFDEAYRNLDRRLEQQQDRIAAYANCEAALDHMLEKLKERAAQEAGSVRDVWKFTERRAGSCVL